MRKLFLFMLLQGVTVAVWAQQQKLVKVYPEVPATKNVPNASPAMNSSPLKAANPFSNSTLTYRIINAPDNTFGYDIYTNGRILIHQPSVPALPGNDGFKTKAGALKIAQLVIDKLKRGELPPTVSIEEMRHLRAIPNP